MKGQQNVGRRGGSWLSPGQVDWVCPGTGGLAASSRGSCEGAADMAVERLGRTGMWRVWKIEPTSF